MSIEFYENLLLRVSRNQVDNFEVTAEGRKLGIDFSTFDDFSDRKYLLQRAIILEILKVEELSEKYSKLLEESNKLYLFNFL